MGKIAVKRKVKIDGGWKFLSVAKDERKQLDWKYLVYKGQRIVSTEGTFYLDYQENGRVRRAVGDHPREAKAALALQMNVLNLREGSLEVDDAPQIQVYRPISGPRISDVVREFVDKPPVKYRKKSFAKYRNALQSFERWTKKTHLSQLDRQDILDFINHLVNKAGLSTSTAVDKANIALFMFNEAGSTILMKKGDWPKITQKQPNIYQTATLKALLAVCNEDEHALFSTFIDTGFRDQEVGFLSWNDFFPKQHSLRVSAKPFMGFAPKNYQERTIPIPESLVEILLKHRERQKKSEYLVYQAGRKGERHYKNIGWHTLPPHVRYTAQGQRGRCEDRPGASTARE
jgi:integrase